MNNQTKKCLLCNNNVEQWTAYSNGRANCACPHCRCAERHRLAALYLNNLDTNFNSLLHIAPERHLHKKLKSVSNNYVAGDIDPSRYPDRDTVYLDVTNINYDHGTFDCIYASHVLEHVIDDTKAMTEMYNVLTTNGKLLVMVPQKMTLEKTYEDSTIVTESDRLKHFGQKDHVRLYGLDFTTRLKQSGFHVEIFYASSMREKIIENMYYDDKHKLTSDDDAIKFGFPYTLLYVCTKN